jgi:hypothetical protein
MSCFQRPLSQTRQKEIKTNMELVNHYTHMSRSLFGSKHKMFNIKGHTAHLQIIRESIVSIFIHFGQKMLKGIKTHYVHIYCT